MAGHGIMTVPGRIVRPAPVSAARTALLTFLLACGIAAPLLYVAMLALVPLGWEGYSSASRTISELSAIGAPTRSVWVPLGIIYTLLVAAFGWGIWLSTRGNRRLRAVGGLMIACGLLGLFWPPMHLREVLAAGGATLTDTLHIVWTAASNLLTLLAMGFAAAAFGTRFRSYSVVTMVLLVAFGVITSLDAPRIQANLPTPLVGMWERLILAAWMLWLVVLAVALLRRQGARRLP